MSAIKPYEPTSARRWLDAQASEVDSREKLEADVRDWIDKRRHRTLGGVSLVQKLQGWLDRQAAITERECRRPNWEYCETCETIAERDEWQRTVDDYKERKDALVAERDRLHRQVALKDSTIEGLRKSLDEIMAERNGLAAKLEAKEQLEHDSAYMRLPVDADGVPIHVGDELETAHGGRGIVEYVGECEVRVCREGEHFRISQNEYAYTCRHVQPDTVESLLEEFGRILVPENAQDGLPEFVERYAERIRKAVEHG